MVQHAALQLVDMQLEGHLRVVARVHCREDEAHDN